MRRALLLQIAFVLATAAAPQDPIATRNHRALALAFFRFTPSPPPAADGDKRLSIDWTQANDLRRFLPTLDEDYEITRFTISYEQGYAAGSLTVELPLVNRGSGFLDPIIDGWHALVLGWSDPIRDATPMGRSMLQLPGESPRGSAFGIGDLSAVFTRDIGRNSVARAALKLPTGNARDLLGSGGFDLGLSLEYRRQLGQQWSVFAQVALIHQGGGLALKNEREWVDQECLALIFAHNSKDTWVAQWQSESSALRSGFAPSDAPHRILTFGYRRRLSSSQWIEGFFSEDRDVFSGGFPEGANIGPDFSAGIRWTVRL
ncbi:MAG TPA: DUF3187 family protein [Fimbriimonadaceae bacterium]|nr:DUF3187 family protein [Fimbriimonadaceae bacterium]